LPACPWLPLSLLISSRLYFYSICFGGADTVLTQVWEVENVVVQASVQEDVEGLVRKVTLLEGELAEARQARGVAEEKFCSLSNASADGAWWLVVFEMECRE
jgi:hypothetical protein